MNPAFFAIGCFFLVQKFEFAFIELLKKLVPADFLQRIFTAVPGKIDAQDAVATLFPGGSLHYRRYAATLLHPGADRIVIAGRGIGFGVACCFSGTAR